MTETKTQPEIKSWESSAQWFFDLMYVKWGEPDERFPEHFLETLPENAIQAARMLGAEITLNESALEQGETEFFAQWPNDKSTNCIGDFGASIRVV